MNEFQSLGCVVDWKMKQEEDFVVFFSCFFDTTPVKQLIGNARQLKKNTDFIA